MASAFDAVEIVRDAKRRTLSSSSWSCRGSATSSIEARRSPRVEHGVEPLSACSVIVAPIDVDGEQHGSVGVLGPTRMNYPQAMATVDVVSDQLRRRLGES
jgi:heat-inducible transcriptional repressor